MTLWWHKKIKTDCGTHTEAGALNQLPKVLVHHSSRNYSCTQRHTQHIHPWVKLQIGNTLIEYYCKHMYRKRDWLIEVRYATDRHRGLLPLLWSPLTLAFHLKFSVHVFPAFPVFHLCQSHAHDQEHHDRDHLPTSGFHHQTHLYWHLLYVVCQTKMCHVSNLCATETTHLSTNAQLVLHT